MKKMLVIVLMLCATVGAVEPAYEGRLGNPEEPALRPIKWALSGVAGFFYNTGKGFRDGNMNTPALGSVEAFRGLGVGTVELGNSVWNGMVYKPITSYREYRRIHKWNSKINEDLLLRNVRDAGSTFLVLYPVLKYNDHYPLENDEKVAIRLERARMERERSAAQAAQRDPLAHLDPVERAQLQRVPERAAYGINKRDKKHGKHLDGNLLRLAK